LSPFDHLISASENWSDLFSFCRLDERDLIQTEKSRSLKKIFLLAIQEGGR
jgi:hypothetical protein